MAITAREEGYGYNRLEICWNQSPDSRNIVTISQGCHYWHLRFYIQH